MTDITVSRGGTSVTLPANVESGGIPVTWSTSKPQQSIDPVVDVNPRARDNFKNVQSFTVSGTLTGSTAYVDARTLAQDLIKPFSEGTALTLDLSNFAGLGSYTVAPNLDRALELTYLPGQRNWVEYTLNLTRIDTLSTTTASQESTDPTPIPKTGADVTITNPVNSESITIDKDLQVTRTVGRPNSSINAYSDEIVFIDKTTSAVDEFEIVGEFFSGTADTDAATAVEDVFGTALGRQALTLDFDSSYGLGSFNVVPSGGQAGRIVIAAGEEGARRVGPATMRVVTN